MTISFFIDFLIFSGKTAQSLTGSFNLGYIRVDLDVDYYALRLISLTMNMERSSRLTGL